MLAAFAERATKLVVPQRLLNGLWPDLAEQAEVADVMVCGNVVYNVAGIAPFVTTLTSSARRRVVVELAARHPLTELNLLWQRFHGITRPAGLTASDCGAALAEVGIELWITEWSRASRTKSR